MWSLGVASVLKAYSNILESSEKKETTLCIEVGILNFYSMTNLSINTEIGEIRSFNRLSNDDLGIFKIDEDEHPTFSLYTHTTIRKRPGWLIFRKCSFICLCWI
jgi:hypothetical protein